jgi:hypothetical protein
LLSILLPAFTMSACAAPSDSASLDVAATASPITGGRLTTDGEWPAVVSLGGCTGTLVHARLVVFAAHCGTWIPSVRFGPSADAPERVVATSRCGEFPNARLGDGSDLAYCVLAEPVLDVEPVRILAGCEADAELVGEPAWVVGYGLDSQDGMYGQQRAGVSRVQSVGDEVFLEASAVDTCIGDSGGPLFVEREEPDGTRQRRLFAVTSAGTTSTCGTGMAHYVNIARKIDWLEQASQLDVTPCFTDATWMPTAGCRATRAPTPTEEGVAAGAADAPAADERPALETCGSAFSAPADDTPPLLEWASPGAPRTDFELPPDAKYIETEVALDATDAGWGVEQVALSLRGENGELLLERVDQVPPFGLPTLRLPAGHFVLRAEASDYAGNTTGSEIELNVTAKLNAKAMLTPGGGCSLSPGRPSGNGLRGRVFALAASLVIHAWRRRRALRLSARA